MGLDGSAERLEGLHRTLSQISKAPILIAKSEDARLVPGYAEPEHMGVDRWLATLAARDAVEGKTLLSTSEPPLQWTL